MMRSVLVVCALVVAVQGLALKGIESANPCGPLSTCSQCAFESNCGWCGSLQICMPGELVGPATGNCTEWHFNYCKDEPCSAYNGVGCDACVLDPFCGWCESSGVCLEGNSAPLFAECDTWFDESCPDTKGPTLVFPMPWTNADGTPEETTEEIVQAIADRNKLPYREIVHQSA